MEKGGKALRREKYIKYLLTSRLIFLLTLKKNSPKAPGLLKPPL